MSDNGGSEASGNVPAWPNLPFEAWGDTCATLHMWTQIVGKVRLVCTPWTNHSWHVPLYLTARGLTTSPIPHGSRLFQVDFDFLGRQLSIETSDGGSRTIKLEPRSVASFYAELMAKLEELRVGVSINATPNEVPDPIPFEEDREHDSYDAEYAERFWRVLLQTDRVFTAFRARFLGKNSPVHFFWGSCDLAVTRFSGRPAPPHPGGIPGLPDWVTREAYSHEVSSAGFWPGGAASPTPIFYSYAYPTPEGFGEVEVGPAGAFFSEEMGEFMLPYDQVRQSPDPDAQLMAFLESTYEAAADLAGWNRASLETPPGFPRFGA
jgi:hypothetical protein